MDYCSESRDWTTLEYDVLGAILNKMVSVYDYLQFSLVCKSWYFVALRYKHRQSIITSKVPQLPMLIVPLKQHSLYDLTTNEIRPVHFKFSFNKRCCGSSFGWLIMLEETLDILLFNPFSGTVIPLPPIAIDEKPDYFPDLISKAILTKDPSLYPNDYIVVAIYGSCNNLCLMKAYDKTWIYYDCPEYNIYFGDVNVCNDTLYALDYHMTLWKVEVENTSISLKRVIFSLNLDNFLHILVYLVESSKRELLVVSRFFLRESVESDSELEESYSMIVSVKTTKFAVYKVAHECEDGIHRVEEVESLDGDAMFIGDNQSMCISTKDFPKCLPNRIYFTDNCDLFPFPLLYGPQDAGIYNLEDKSFGKHYIPDPAHRNLPPPIWIVPTICFKDDFED